MWNRQPNKLAKLLRYSYAFFKEPVVSQPCGATKSRFCCNWNCLLVAKLFTTAMTEGSNNGCATEISLIACGSFNPVTYMHLRLFELARDFLRSQGKSVRRGYISPVSDGYGKKELVSAQHRLAMCKLAISNSSWIEVLDWEADQPHWSPTVQVLKKYAKSLHCPGSSSKLMVLCGADFLESFAITGLWKPEDIKTIVADYGLVVVTRPTYDPDKFIQNSDLLQELAANIFVVHQPFENDLSSTQIRRALRAKQSIRYLTPDPVIDYIVENKLYSQIPEMNNEVLAPFRVNAKT